MIGLLYGISLTAVMSSSVFSQVLIQPYGEPFPSTDIDSIATNNCTSDTFLCATAGETNNDTLLYFACGNCLTILTETSLNAPKREGLVWWYYTKSDSFGFSPNSYIYQDSGDTYDMSDEVRLSWSFINGGYRAGSTVSYEGELTRYLFTVQIPITSKHF